jgi:membrane-bound ClpP family serine protease
MITYTVGTDRSETGAATNHDDALAEALATVLMLHAHHAATEPGAPMGPCTVRVGDAEPILIRDSPPSGDDHRDHANLAAFLTQLYRDLTEDPLAMLPTIEPPASA